MRLTTLICITALAACGDVAFEPGAEVGEEPFSSNQATLLDFELEAEYVAASVWDLERLAEEQLFYTIGQLNGENSVGRLDKLQLTILERSAIGELTRVRYRAKLPVGWGSKTNLPTTYSFKLPKRVDAVGLATFTDKYKATCVDWGAHDVDAGSMWYYYRPRQSGCGIVAEDVTLSTARITPSVENTTGKYPEIDKIWSDSSLDVIAIFGKYEDGATTSSDAGIAAYNQFVSAVKSLLGSGITTVPASVPTSPGVAMPDIEASATLSGGRRVKITMLLVDNVRTAGAAFDTRYSGLSAGADLIFYNGHAGLGANVRALARKGRFVAGKYQIFFMNGCDTFAYVDGALAELKASLNPDDPNGTKYLDMVTNAMPAFFSSMSGGSLALIRGVVDPAQPKSYEQIFTSVDRSQVIVVTGEEDNVYQPGGGGGGGGNWTGMREEASVAAGAEKRWSTPALAAGTYLFTMTHDPARPGGDADLYVRKNTAPSTSAYDCRPYANGSDEVCSVTLASPAVIHVMVRGYASGSNYFALTGAGSGGGGGAWAGMTESGSVLEGAQARYTTPSLPAGTYTVRLAHDGAHPGGDADLYVRKGTAPTLSAYDCRPYEEGSTELCTVTLSAPAVIHMMVFGYADGASYYVLTAK